MVRQVIPTQSMGYVAQEGHFYDQDSHREALATLIYSIGQSEGWALVVGRAGSGKTELVAQLQASLGSEVRSVRLSAADCPTPMDLFRHMADALEMGVPCHYKARFLFNLRAYIEQCHRQGHKILLLIDGAQNWGPEMLKEVELLGNEDQFSPRVLNIFLFARPEFLGTLESMGATNLKHHLRRFRRLAHPDDSPAMAGERRRRQRQARRIDYFDNRPDKEMRQLAAVKAPERRPAGLTPRPALAAPPQVSPPAAQPSRAGSHPELDALLDLVLGPAPSR